MSVKGSHGAMQLGGNDHGALQSTPSVAGATVSITAGRLAFGRPVAYADAVLNRRALLDFGRPVSFDQGVLVKRGTFLSGRNVIFTHVVNIGKGVLNLAGQTVLFRGGVQIAKGVLNFSRPVTFTSAVAKLLHRLNIGKGVSFKKGVGFKKVGEKDVSTISNPEDQ